MHTIIVVGIAFWWVNGSIRELDNRLSSKIENLSERVARIEEMLSRTDLCFSTEGRQESK